MLNNFNTQKEKITDGLRGYFDNIKKHAIKIILIIIIVIEGYILSASLFFYQHRTDSDLDDSSMIMLIKEEKISLSEEIMELKPFSLYWDHDQGNPFYKKHIAKEEKKTKQVQKPVKAQKPGRSKTPDTFLEFTGLVEIDGERKAMIKDLRNNRSAFFSQGQTIDNWKIITITRNTITFKSKTDGQQTDIKIGASQ